nr:hypothetical protein GCM10025732_22540 [Glycomyces mayteni]
MSRRTIMPIDRSTASSIFGLPCTSSRNDERASASADVSSRASALADRGAVEEGDLAEDLGGAGDVEHGPLAGGRGAEDADGAGADHDERLARLALEEQEVPAPVVALHGHARDLPPRLRVEAGEHGDACKRVFRWADTHSSPLRWVPGRGFPPMIAVFSVVVQSPVSETSRSVGSCVQTVHLSLGRAYDRVYVLSRLLSGIALLICRLRGQIPAA